MEKDGAAIGRYLRQVVRGAVRFWTDRLGGDRTIVTSGADAAMRFWDVATLAPEGPRMTVTHGSTYWFAWYRSNGDVAGLAPSPSAQLDDVSRPFVFPGLVNDWVRATCALAGTDITPAQWAQYVGDQPYRHVCTT